MTPVAPRFGPSILLAWDCYQLGDVLQRGSAVAAALRSVFPRAWIDLATRAEVAPLLRTDPNLGDVFELDTCLVEDGESPPTVRGALAARSYDALVNVGGAGPVEVRTLTALYNHFKRKSPHLIADMGVVEGSPDNLLRSIMEVARQRQQLLHRVDFVLSRAGLTVGHRATVRLDDAFAVPRPETNAPVVFVHTRSNATARCYPLGAELIAALRSAGYFVWEAESERRDIRAVAWMIRHSDYVVTVDTAILHVANGLGVPSLCLVTQVLPSWVGVDDFIYKPVDCLFCVSRKTREHEGEPCGRNFECMRVEPAEVVRRVGGYFATQTLRDSRDVREYLATRMKQYDIVRAIEKNPTGVKLTEVPVDAPRGTVAA